MSEHHKDATAAVARTVFEGLTPDQRAEVQAEADAKGVDAIEIVRRSLDILIGESNPSARGVRVVAKPADR